MAALFPTRFFLTGTCIQGNKFPAMILTGIMTVH